MLNFLAQEWFFLVALAGFITGIVLTKRFPHYSEGDFRVLFILLVFLALTKGLEESGLLKWIAAKVEKGSYPTLKLVLTTFVLSMVVTNDVALLTVVPLSLHLSRVNVANLVILEALAANAGSALTPIGNPQNIFLYHFYELEPITFVKTILPFSIFFLVLILLFVPKERTAPGETVEKTLKVDWKTAITLLLFFVLFIPCALRFLPVWLGVLPLLYLLFFRRETLLKVDYFLLATFFFFFGFTDNVSHLLGFKLENPDGVFLYAALISQILSNVPTALLMADFTHQWKALLWGVNVGGFGTLIASLANLIAYKLYSARYGAKREFLIKFHLVGLLFLFLGIALYFVLYSNWVSPVVGEIFSTLKVAIGFLITAFKAVI